MSTLLVSSSAILVPGARRIADVADFDFTVWFGLVPPAATPRPIIERLNRQVGEVLRTRDLKEKFAAAGIDITPSSPEERGERIRADLPYYARLMREAGMQPE